MSAEQPRIPAGCDAGGQFTSYGRPPLPPQRVEGAPARPVQSTRIGAQDLIGADGQPFTAYRFSADVALSVVAVCCPECVYGGPA